MKWNPHRSRNVLKSFQQHKHILVGVDGGGSKTVARAEDPTGLMLGEGYGGAANIRLSVTDSWLSVRTAVQSALSAAGLDVADTQLKVHVLAGLAGTEVASARGGFLSGVHPYATLALESDGMLSCVGAHLGEDGAVIAVGTGTIGYQIRGEQHSRAGGWGFPHGDEGGGAWLGMEVARLTMQYLDGRQEHSPLFQAVLDRFQNSSESLLVWACEANATRFATLAPLVVEYARGDDRVASELLRRAAGEIELLAMALERQSGEDLPCCLLGGLAAPLVPYLRPSLRERLRPPHGDAVDGALLLLRRRMARPAHR